MADNGSHQRCCWGNFEIVGFSPIRAYVRTDESNAHVGAEERSTTRSVKYDQKRLSEARPIVRTHTRAWRERSDDSDDFTDSAQLASNRHRIADVRSSRAAAWMDAISHSAASGFMPASSPSSCSSFMMSSPPTSLPLMYLRTFVPRTKPPVPVPQYC